MAQEVIRTATQILEIFARERALVESLGRAAGNALRVHFLLQGKPVVSVAAAASELNLTAPTVRSAIENRETPGFVRETTGKRRDRLFVYSRYLDALQEDADESFSGSTS